MLKIVVFDGGWGGEVVAGYLAKELKMVEVIRVIDWANAPYEEKDITTVLNLVCNGVAPYVGKVDLIVLGGYVVSLVENALRECYPGQKIVSMGINYRRIARTRNPSNTITILGDAKIQNETLYSDMAKNLSFPTLIFPDCSGWENLINLGEMSAEVLRYELQDYFMLHNERSKKLNQSPPLTRQIKKLHLTPFWRKRVDNFIAIDLAKIRNYDFTLPVEAANSKRSRRSSLIKADTVLVLNTHYWDITPEIEQVFGYRVDVIDFRSKLLHDVCLALNLRGVHGKKSWE